MRHEETNREIDQIEAELRNAYYRYQLALKDGAVSSIVKEVIDRITDLERKLQTSRTLGSSSFES
jgi:hypothetical protein